MPQVFQNPKQLVDEFKKSGEFDRLRRQLLTHFANSDEVRPLMSRVEEIARDKLSSDERLEHKTREAVHSEVMQDMDRYPIVERAVSDLAVLKDEALLTSIEQYVHNILQGESNDNTKLWNAEPARRKRNEVEDNDESSDYSEDEEPGDDELLIITEAERKNTAALSTGYEVERPADEATGAPPRTVSQVEANAIISGPTSPRSSHAVQRLPVVSDYHTPPRPAPHADNKKPFLKSAASPLHSSRSSANSPSTVWVPSSDSLAGELLVNGIPVGGSAISGLVIQQNEARCSSVDGDQAAHNLSTRDTPSLIAHVHAEGGSPTPEKPDTITTASRPDTKRDGAQSPLNVTKAESSRGELPEALHYVHSPSHNTGISIPERTRPPTHSPTRWPTRSPTRSVSPLAPPPGVPPSPTRNS